MKKLIAMLLALVMVLSLAACGASEPLKPKLPPPRPRLLLPLRPKLPLPLLRMLP